MERYVKERYELAAQTLSKKLERRNFEVIICQNLEDGQLVNVDSVGNRVAALTYGPDKVVAFVSMRKVYGDVDTTLEMVHKNTAPLNAHRLGLEKTPCIKKGNCGDCLQSECICNTIAITRRSMTKNRIAIFLILEDIGL